MHNKPKEVIWIKTLSSDIMGLYIQSLSNLPVDGTREYYIYLLDYGWSEPLGEALMQNYEKMADIAAQHNAVVIRGTQRVHFEDEVLSWHHINGENAEDLLPAILITNRHPLRFQQSYGRHPATIEGDLKLILVPLKKFCKTTTDVVVLIEKLFKDVLQKKDLLDFQIAKEMKRGLGHAIVDSIILEPNIGGIGVNFKKLMDIFRK